MRHLLPSLALVVCVAVIAGGGGASARPPIATAASGVKFTLQETIGVTAPTNVKWDYDPKAGTASWHHPCCEAGEWTSNYSFTPPPTLTTGGADTFNLKIEVSQCKSGSGCDFSMFLTGDVTSADAVLNVHANFNDTTSGEKQVAISLPDGWDNRDTASVKLHIDSGPTFEYTYQRDAPPPPVIVPAPSRFGQSVTANAPKPGAAAVITTPKLGSARVVTAAVRGVSEEDLAVIRASRNECIVNYDKAKQKAIEDEADRSINDLADQFAIASQLDQNLERERDYCLAYVTAVEEVVRAAANAHVAAAGGCALSPVKLSVGGSASKPRLRSFRFGRPGDKPRPLKATCKLSGGKLTVSVASRSQGKPLRSIVGPRLRLGIVRSRNDAAGGRLSVVFRRHQ